MTVIVFDRAGQAYGIIGGQQGRRGDDELTERLNLSSLREVGKSLLSTRIFDAMALVIEPQYPLKPVSELRGRAYSRKQSQFVPD